MNLHFDTAVRYQQHPLTKLALDAELELVILFDRQKSHMDCPFVCENTGNWLFSVCGYFIYLLRFCSMQNMQKKALIHGIT